MFVVPPLGPTAPGNVLLSSTIVTVGAPVLYVPLLALALVAVVAMLAACRAMRRREPSWHRRTLLGNIAHVTSRLLDVTATPAGLPARADCRDAGT